VKNLIAMALIAGMLAVAGIGCGGSQTKAQTKTGGPGGAGDTKVQKETKGDK
jgi:hypothetical protein